MCERELALHPASFIEEKNTQLGLCTARLSVIDASQQETVGQQPVREGAGITIIKGWGNRWVGSSIETNWDVRTVENPHMALGSFERTSITSVCNSNISYSNYLYVYRLFLHYLYYILFVFTCTILSVLLCCSVGGAYDLRFSQ